MSWIDDYKGLEPWDFSKLPWGDDVSPGPWPFEPQPDKPCYNEGDAIVCSDQPVWSDNPSDVLITPVHNPHCGYWTSQPAEHFPPSLTGNIYGILDNSLYCLLFDGFKLTWIGMYQPDYGNIMGLNWHDGNLITVAKDGDNCAFLRHIAPDTLELCDTTFPFNKYDITTLDHANLIRMYDTNRIFVCSGYDFTFIELKNAEKEGRGHFGLVRRGTDGNLYVLTGYRHPQWCWNAEYIPVTGDKWDHQWTHIPDNQTDSPVIIIPPDPLPSCQCATNNGVSGTYYKGDLYLVAREVYGGLKKINTSQYRMLIDVTSFWERFLVAAHSKIYVVGGPGGNFQVEAYNAGTLAKTGDQSEAMVGYPKGMVAIGDYIILLYESVAPSLGVLVKLHSDSLEVVDSILMNEPDGADYNVLRQIDSKHVAAGRWYGITIIDIDNMIVVDDMDLSERGLERNHVDIIGMEGY